MEQVYSSKYWKIEFDSILKREYITIFDESSFLTHELFIFELKETIQKDPLSQNNYAQTMLLDLKNAHFLLNYPTFLKLVEIMNPVFNIKNFKKIAIIESQNKNINTNLRMFSDLFENITEYKFFEKKEQANKWLNK